MENEQRKCSSEETHYLYTSSGSVLVESIRRPFSYHAQVCYLSTTYHELVPALEIKLRRSLFGARSYAAARYRLSVSNRQEVV